MKVTVLGAAGRTGRHLVDQARAAEYEITAFVRTAAQPDALAGQVDVVEGDATDAAGVERAVRGADAVLSGLGPRKGGPPDAMRLRVDGPARSTARRRAVERRVARRREPTEPGRGHACRPLAAFMLGQLEDMSYVRKAPFVV